MRRLRFRPPRERQQQNQNERQKPAADHAEHWCSHAQMSHCTFGQERSLDSECYGIGADMGMPEVSPEKIADRHPSGYQSFGSGDALRAAEAKLRSITESGIIGVFYWKMTGAITDANDSFLRMVGRDRAEIENGAVDWRNLTPPEWYEEDERRAAEIVE